MLESEVLIVAVGTVATLETATTCGLPAVGSGG